jgi:hypothetical protein
LILAAFIMSVCLVIHPLMLDVKGGFPPPLSTAG